MEWRNRLRDAAPVVPTVWDVALSAGRWTTEGPTEAGNRQFVVADPDGYLWRPFCDLGVTPALQ